MQSGCRLPRTLWLILAAALGLRLLGAACANLTFDERAHVALAETIDFRPGHLHLVSRTVSHPLLCVYVIKLSGLLFGTSDFGLRMLHVLAGTATILPVYLLGKRVFSQSAGLWAAALLAVDQFHASWSRVMLHEGWLLLFTAWALLQFLRLLENATSRNAALLGVLLGLGYLAKETTLLLIPAFWIYLWITPRHRGLLRRPPWYLAHGVFLAVVAPDVIWNLAQGIEGYPYRDMVFLAAPPQLSLKSFSLYLGEVFRGLIHADVLDKEYEQGHVFACHWPAGLLYLGATAAAVRRHKDPQVRLLLVTFLLIFLAFTLLPGGRRFDPFWWASISLIPAVVFAGWVLDWASRGGRTPMIAGLLLLGYLGVRYLPAAVRPGPEHPRTDVRAFADDFLKRGGRLLKRGDLRGAEDHFIFVLNIEGPNAGAYYGLALVALRRGQAAKAESLLRRCLEVDPDHRPAQQRLRRRRASP